MGVQNKPPQDVSQWYADYFELKATKRSRGHNKSLCPVPTSYLEGPALGAFLVTGDYQRSPFLTHVAGRATDY